MQQEEELDALLTLHPAGGEAQTDSSLVESSNGYDSLRPLLAAANRVAQLGIIDPASEFITRLETQLFAQADELRQRDGAEPLYHVYQGDDAPTLPGNWWAAPPEGTTEADGVALWPVAHPSGPRAWKWRLLVWQVAAAVLLLVVAGATIILASASAGPGTPLYGLHRFEQGVQVSFAGSAGERTRLHLTFAQEALDALDTAAGSHQAGGTYEDALATFTQEIRAATSTLDVVPPGSEHAGLAAELGQLRAQGRADLHVALAVLPWSGRIETTTVLGDIGASVLHVDEATMVYVVGSGPNQHVWEITIIGSGFQPGAVLLINGQVAGTVTSVTPTTLQAELPGDESTPLPASVGAANPDDTAAQTSSVSNQGQRQQSAATPTLQLTPQPTPSVDDHGGNDGGGGHDGGGGGSGGPGSSGGSGH